MDGANVIAAGALLAIGLATIVMVLLAAPVERIRKDYEYRRWRRRS